MSCHFREPIFARVNIKSLKSIKKALENFTALLGFEINATKSFALFSKSCEENQSATTWSIGIYSEESTRNPFRNSSSWKEFEIW